MEDSRWKQIKSLFDQAVVLPASERSTFLTQECGGDLELFEEVMALLKADERPHSLLNHQASDHLEAILDSDLKGHRIGEYQVIRKIASGGMGTVYLAERADGQFQQTVALKVIRKGMDSKDILRRFSSERQILARLEHPAVARLFGGGATDDGQPYFTMEYVDGLSITEYCNRNKLNVEQRLRLFAKVCEAVQYAHQNLVIHRDIKPSNILVTPNGNVKLLDFGIARMLENSGNPQEVEQLTRTGMRVLTPVYASPEQLMGESLSTASDVYSLGVVLFELLTEERPFDKSAPTPEQMAQVFLSGGEPSKPSDVLSKRIRSGQVVERIAAIPAAALQKTLRGDLDNICMMALRREPQRRYASAGQLQEDIVRYLRHQPVGARPDTFSYRTSKFIRRNRLAVAAAAASFIVVAALVTFYTIKLAQERDRARTEAVKAQQVANFLTDLFDAANPNEAQGEEITAKELLAEGAERVEKELSSQPEVQAALLDVLGNSYHNLGHYEEALSLLNKAYEIRVNLLGRNHPDAAYASRRLGTIWHDFEEYDSAEFYYRQALMVDSVYYGLNHAATLEDLSNLAIALKDKGAFEEAEALFRKVITLGKQPPGIDSTDLANSLNHLGQMLRRQGKLTEAELLLREGLDIAIQVLGHDHFQVNSSRGALGKLLYDKGDYEGALSIYRTALTSSQKLVGNEHMFSAGFMNSLANILLEMGQYDEANSLFMESLNVMRRVFPEAHPTISYPLIGLGALNMRTGHPEKAELYLREALDLREKGHGSESRQVADAQRALGDCLIELKRYDEAEAFLLKSHTSLLKLFGIESQFTQQAICLLVKLYEKNGKPDAAADWQKQLLTDTDCS